MCVLSVHIRTQPDDECTSDDAKLNSSQEYRDPPKPGEPKEPFRPGKFSPYRAKVHTEVSLVRDESGEPVKRSLPVVRPPQYKRAAVFTLSAHPSSLASVTTNNPVLRQEVRSFSFAQFKHKI